MGVNPTNNQYYSLLNLSVICGLASGTSIYNNLYAAYAVNDGFYIVNGNAYIFPSTNNTTGVIINLSSGNQTNFDISAPISSNHFAEGELGSNLFFLDTSNNIQVNSTSGNILFTVPSSALPANIDVVVNYNGTLFVVDWVNSQAMSILIAYSPNTGWSASYSPVFPLSFNPNNVSVPYAAFDNVAGVLYGDLAGTAVFANLSPMEF